MNELKFRAWLPESDEMIYINSYDGDEYHFSFSKDGIKCEYFDADHVKEGGGEIIDDPRWITVMSNIMRQTGFTDKFSESVFESDIVIMGKKLFVIRYFVDYGMFGLSELKNESDKPVGHGGSSTQYSPYVLSPYYQKRIEVVGNIYENSNLLP